MILTQPGEDLGAGPMRFQAQGPGELDDRAPGQGRGEGGGGVKGP